MDIISEEKRSWNMSRIRGKDTKPEITVRSMLHRMGYRFRLHRKDLPGKPDIVLPKYNTVIFVHGCFWHRHKGCKYAYTPKSRAKFWKDKFAGTVKRDKLHLKQLKENGWEVFIVWECETKDMNRLKNIINKISQKINGIFLLSGDYD
ncbi:MAG: DNA mismatch endonuclease Vsr [Thermodesulfobacteriota bacterium]|nr:DNA mismatch endonuclease Vsr [Thermodesulfobacteriota bacterium]